MGTLATKFLPSAQSLPRRFLTSAELARVLQAVEQVVWPQNRARFRTLFLLLANLGPRISELLAVRAGDVDLGEGTITLPTLKRWKTLPDGARVRVPHSRILPLVPALCAELDCYIRVEGLGPGDLLFPRTWPKYVWEVFKRALGKAGLSRHHRLHDLRHSAATRLADQTRDPMLVRDVLGHASIATSNIYLHTVNLREKLLAVPPVLPGMAPAADPGAREPATDPLVEVRDRLARVLEAVTRPAGGPSLPRHPAQDLLPYSPAVWRTVNGWLAAGMICQTDVADNLALVAEDEASKPSLTPQGRQRLRVLVATIITVNEVGRLDGPALEEATRCARGTVRPLDPVWRRVRALAARAGDEGWLLAQERAASEQAREFRTVDLDQVWEDLVAEGIKAAVRRGGVPDALGRPLC